jgi:Zn-dependent oligopeptidase
VTITVNRDGMFFHQKASNNLNFRFLGRKTYPGATLKAEAAILFHELGHLLLLQGFLRDNILGDPKQSKLNGIANDNLVDQHCGKLVGGLK